MPRIKKTIVADNVEVQPLIPQEGESSITTPVATADPKDIVTNENNTEKTTIDIIPDTLVPLTKIPKEHFKQLYVKDTCWLENDIYQTLADMTEGKKSAKALIINQALKDYLQKSNMEIKPLKVKGKKN